MAKTSIILRAVVLGVVAGSRAMTPLAAVANAARTKRLPKGNGAPDFLSSRWVSAATMAIAVYELIGDKQSTAPDRVATPAVVVRTLNAALAGAAVAPKRQRWVAAAVAGATAAAASWVTWKLRTRAMREHDQTSTGFVEDAIVVPTAIAAAG